MSYSSASDVAALCQNLVNTASNFSASTIPTLTQVNVWLSSGCAAINAKLAGRGYGPIPTTSGAYDLAAQANSCFAAWFAERSRLNARVSGDERTRADMFKRDYDTLMDVLTGIDLSQAGVTQTKHVYGGGISRSDKQINESNTDIVQSRFKRGDFSNPDAPTSAGGNTAS